MYVYIYMYIYMYIYVCVGMVDPPLPGYVLRSSPGLYGLASPF